MYKLHTVQYSTVQLILQSVIMFPWSYMGDYMVNQCSETTLILCRPLCLLKRHLINVMFDRRKLMFVINGFLLTWILKCVSFRQCQNQIQDVKVIIYCCCCYYYYYYYLKKIYYKCPLCLLVSRYVRGVNCVFSFSFEML